MMKYKIKRERKLPFSFGSFRSFLSVNDTHGLDMSTKSYYNRQHVSKYDFVLREEHLSWNSIRKTGQDWINSTACFGSLINYITIWLLSYLYLIVPLPFYICFVSLGTDACKKTSVNSPATASRPSILLFAGWSRLDTSP